MKNMRIITVLATLLATCVILFAGVRFGATAPGDAMSVRRSVAQRPEVKALRSEYTAMTRRLDLLRADDVKALLGAPVTVATNQVLVLPVFAPNFLYETGYAPPKGSDLSRVETYAIGTTGVLELHVGHNGISVKRSVLYHRTDKDSTPLLKETDLAKRLEWDKQRFEQIKKRLPRRDLTKLISKYLPVKNDKKTDGQQSPAGDRLKAPPEE